MHIIKLLLIIVFIVLFSTSANGRDNVSCGIQPGKPLENHYGPYDFTNPQHAKRFPVVLKRHFTDEIRTLKQYRAEGDLDYTLRAIPNFLPALHSMSILQRKWIKEDITNKKVYSAECYFKRAIYFAPKDFGVKYLYAIHLHQLKNYNKAEKLYLQVIKSNYNNIEAHYNLGLLLVDMGKLEAAKKHAKLAYAGNFPLQGLKKKLIEKGAWD